MERVEGEQSGYGEALPKSAGDPGEEQKQEQRRRGVNDHAGQVVALRVQAEHLYIRHVRQPFQGVPVRHGAGCERPDEARRHHSTFYHRVGRYVSRIVVTYELVIRRLQEDGKGDGNQYDRELYLCPHDVSIALKLMRTVYALSLQQAEQQIRFASDNNCLVSGPELVSLCLVSLCQCPHHPCRQKIFPRDWREVAPSGQ